MMVGDGPNDVLAFSHADVAVLTLEQTGNAPDSLKSKADHVINDISQVLDIDF
ncbi:MAG: hypothetical protein VZQ49_02470 [Methanobrevibacter sp.]|nr:hypothetical protein [Methanobrevibacter sp.]